MTPGDRSAARQALDAGRDIHARLDQIRDPRDVSSDITALWNTAEQAMRAMLGGSSLSGQTIVRELRQRNLLSLNQANTLAAFWDASDRVQAPDYTPTLTDVGHARRGYTQLYEALEAPSIHPPGPSSAQGVAGQVQAGAFKPAAKTAAPTTPASGSDDPPPPAKKSGCFRASFGFVLFVGVLVVAFVAIIALALGFFGRPSYDKKMGEAITMMTQGQEELAKAAFSNIVIEHPQKAEPRVYLARIMRQQGDIAKARQELTTAIQLEPQTALPQREMGLLLLSADNPELAVNFFKRAVEFEPDDKSALGYLGCALIRSKQPDVGRRFLDRAGPGAWTSCAAE